MSLIDDARKLEPSDFAIGIGFFVGVVAPGFLTLFLYKPALVTSLDILKLLLFSTAITLPIVIINFIFVAMLYDEDKKTPELRLLSIGALALACSVQYLALLISYICAFIFNPTLGNPPA